MAGPFYLLQHGPDELDRTLHHHRFVPGRPVPDVLAGGTAAQTWGGPEAVAEETMNSSSLGELSVHWSVSWEALSAVKEVNVGEEGRKL